MYDNYLDESFIHNNYKLQHDSLYHPDDATCIPPKERHKGERLCFVAAIIASGPTTGKFLGFQIFTGGTRQPKDYHAMFTHDFFVDWFADLLDEIESMNLHGVIFAMDNAKCHKGLPDGTPKATWKKPQLLDTCRRLGVDGAVAASKTYVDRNIEPDVVQMAREHGHIVASTPPYHSDLQPIEMVWAWVKGRVVRQYSTSTTLANVRLRLDAAFDALPSLVIYNCIRHTDTKVTAMYEYLEALDMADDDAGQASSSSAISEKKSVLDSLATVK
ncbi:hypothetical protein H257_16091 [Aphanomyces astaci]|uniref:Tc1-like transposase DDE domain-containing protein n=1 Tax=Aphanomyces astaci TaxID=112090 RepID=W4FLN8_APHAT|nr:hypothetical protein H257_16091 [Aphanomyces astaci]ETV67729.1 hypothetical protein H257_16091 [Aphanomyces astaci]|eukprot:XP_009842722.1 hypothetical protein H257_16091 [Aphanomyces astaci]